MPASLLDLLVVRLPPCMSGLALQCVVELGSRHEAVLPYIVFELSHVVSFLGYFLPMYLYPFQEIVFGKIIQV